MIKKRKKRGGMTYVIFISNDVNKMPFYKAYKPVASANRATRGLRKKGWRAYHTWTGRKPAAWIKDMMQDAWMTAHGY